MGRKTLCLATEEGKQLRRKRERILSIKASDLHVRRSSTLMQAYNPVYTAFTLLNPLVYLENCDNGENISTTSISSTANL